LGVSRVNGLVLRYANYRDNDRILTILSREAGLISATARGCRRPKSPLLGASELFVYGEFVLFENRGRYSVNEAEIKESFYTLREDVSRFAAAMAMLTVAEKGATDQKNEELFDTLYYCLSYTAYAPVKPGDMAVCFLLKALDDLGFRPSLTHCAICNRDLRGDRQIRFAPAQGGAVCDGHGMGSGVQAISLEAARRILLLNKDELQRAVLPEAVRKELLLYLGEYAETMLECSIRSLRQI